MIGNGFDLHHGVHSSYRDFSVWLQRHNYVLYRKLLNVCTSNKLWWNFEEALAYVDRDFLLSASDAWLPKNWDKDKDKYADLLYAGDIARNTGTDLWNDIGKSFRKWVCSIHWERISDKKKLMIDYEAHFITFNYSTFLESQYGINNAQILYIHGRKDSMKNPPIIGHGDIETFDNWFKETSRYNKSFYRSSKSQLPEIEIMTEGVEEYFSLSQKPVDQIIRKNQTFFEDLYDIKHVYVLGHSMNSVDIPYFQVVEKYNNDSANINWHISYYDDKEKSQLMNVAFSNFHSIEQPDMFRLEDMML